MSIHIHIIRIHQLDAERLIGAWNDRQTKRMPMLFSPTIGAAITTGYWFLWVRCPACRTINAIDLRTLDRYHAAPVTSLIPALSCRSCRPNAPFAELVRLSRTSIADEMREEHRRRVLGDQTHVAYRAAALTFTLSCRIHVAWTCRQCLEIIGNKREHLRHDATSIRRPN
jgi:hypothetical protein